LESSDITDLRLLPPPTKPTKPSDRSIRAPEQRPDGRRLSIFKEIRIEALGLGKF
jgi:hypothetical protein